MRRKIQLKYAAAHLKVATASVIVTEMCKAFDLEKCVNVKLEQVYYTYIATSPQRNNVIARTASIRAGRSYNVGIVP